MKIGLEYEGVMKKDGKIILWRDLPHKTQKIIQGYLDIPPVDNYDCLAEVRVGPIVKITDSNILDIFFSKIIDVTNGFNKEGIEIYWGEENIPQDIHDRIVSGMDKKVKKQTMTFINNGVELWTPSSIDKRRGGGVHINVSGLYDNCVESWALKMHQEVGKFRNPQMRSHYRLNLLYRDRMIKNDRVFEYMSFGMELPKDIELNNLKEVLKFIKHQFHWVQATIKTCEQFEKKESNGT